METQIIRYRPYQFYRYFLPFFFFGEVIIIIGMIDLFEQKEWKHIIVWSLIFMIILIEKINTIRVLRIIVIFSEKQIIVKRHNRDIYMVRQYKDWPYVYYCQSYRHLTYLVFSDKPMEKKTLRKKANRNEIIEKVFDDGAIMIRMNEWVKEKELIKEVIRQNYPNIEEVD